MNGVMRTKEIRLALVCYGGVSLAVYMHGIVKEVWKLAQASQAWHDGGDEAALSDTAAVYAGVLDEIAPHIRLRVLIDIIAGASADRKSVVSGKSVSVRVDLVGRRIIKKKTNQIEPTTN